MFTDLKISAGRRPPTRSEARISLAIGVVFTLLIIAAIFDEYSPAKLSVLFIIVLWVPMLVLHELGHALAARLLGWKVREVVIGFGRSLFEFRIGETNVVIKLAPVEGYVLPAPVNPDNIRLKSMLIYAAGPGAELALLGILLIVFGWDTVFGSTQQVSHIAMQSLAVVILFGAGFNLLPFRTAGAVSDGLGIISSAFMSNESIELRLLTLELRESQNLLQSGDTHSAVELLTGQMSKYPRNDSLQRIFVAALADDQQHDRARELARDKLNDSVMPESMRRAWLLLQATIELQAPEPAYLVLDLALQKALAITPESPDLMAIKGASLVMRGQSEAGGEMLARAWRRNDGSADDALILAYLTIVAHRCRDNAAAEHFGESFRQVNRSIHLGQRVASMTSRKSDAD